MNGESGLHLAWLYETEKKVVRPFLGSYSDWTKDNYPNPLDREFGFQFHSSIQERAYDVSILDLFGEELQ
jgi:hypothetical protein